MPRLARLLIKTSLAYLVAALLLYVLIEAVPLVGGPVAASALRPTVVHLFVVGWLTQLIFGVAYWLFPRRSREAPYGRTAYARAAYVLLNLGLLLRAGSEPALLWSGSDPLRWLLAGSSALQWIATLMFAGYIWSRVRTK